jgi:hypothetical protein
LSTFGITTYWKLSHDYMNSNILDSSGEVDVAAFKNFVQGLIFNVAMLDQYNSVLNVVFNRQEAYVTNGQSLTAFYKDIFKRLKAAGNDPADWLIGEEAMAHMGLRNKFVKIADNYDFGKSDSIKPADLLKSLKKHPDLKFYLYASAFDSFSPPDHYKELVNLLGSKVKYTLFKDGGHENMYEKQLVWDNVRREAFSLISK